MQKLMAALACVELACVDQLLLASRAVVAGMCEAVVADSRNFFILSIDGDVVGALSFHGGSVQEIDYHFENTRFLEPLIRQRRLLEGRFLISFRRCKEKTKAMSRELSARVRAANHQC